MLNLFQSFNRQRFSSITDEGVLIMHPQLHIHCNKFGTSISQMINVKDIIREEESRLKVL